MDGEDEVRKIRPPSTPYGPKKLNWWYEDVINWMLNHPGSRLGEMAEYFGKTQAWMSVVINSDIFKARLEERRKELNIELDELLIYKMKKVAHSSFDALMEQIAAGGQDMKPALLLEVGTRVAEFLEPGEKKKAGRPKNDVSPQQVNVQVVVPVSSNALEEARSKIRQIEAQKMITSSSSKGNVDEEIDL